MTRSGSAYVYHSVLNNHGIFVYLFIFWPFLFCLKLWGTNFATRKFFQVIKLSLGSLDTRIILL